MSLVVTPFDENVSVDEKGTTLSQLWDTKPEDNLVSLVSILNKIISFSREEGATSDCGHQLHRLF